MDSNVLLMQSMLRVIALATGEIPLLVPNGIFGKETAQAVRIFQQESDLPVTGIIDAATWSAITTAYQHFKTELQNPQPLAIRTEDGFTLRFGDQGNHVYLLQAMLIVLNQYYQNFPAVSVSGKFDLQTKRAGMELQRCCHQEVTGILTLHCWKRLVRLYQLTTGT